MHALRMNNANPNNRTEDFVQLREASKQDALQTPPPRMLVLVGIPGSGKSTFAKHLSELGWARISQDDLGTRRKCEVLTVQHLCTGTNVVIDRCNFDKAQRKRWVDYASARKSACGVVVFATSLQECLQRVRERRGHPTLEGEEGEHVVQRVADRFEFPDRTEGFAFCRVIRSETDATRVLSELLSAE